MRTRTTTTTRLAAKKAIQPIKRRAPEDCVAELRRIRETERLRAKSAEIVQPEAIPERLDTPNDAFDGLKPLEVIERGEVDRLWTMIFYLESGVAS